MNFAVVRFCNTQKKQNKHSIFKIKDSQYLFSKKKLLELLVTFGNFNKNEKTFKKKYYNPTTQHHKTITLETNLSLIQQIQILTNHIMSRLQIQIINMTTNSMQNNIPYNTISTMSNKSSQIS